MKPISVRLSVCLALLVTSALTGRSANSPAEEPSGIKFFTGSWQEVLAEAKRQNKPVFIDVYTTWCGPCKRMAKEAFPNPTVGEKFNSSFVNYQLDAEKGEGPTIAKKYAVDGYPTSLFVSANGTLIYKTSGYRGINGMLEEANKAIEATSDPKPLTVWEQEYKNGKRAPEFLYGYLQKMGSLEIKDSKVLEEYIKMVPEADLLTDKNIGLYSRTVSTVNSGAFQLLVNQIPRLSQSPATGQLGADVFSGLQSAVSNDLKRAVNDKNAELMEQVIAAQTKALIAFRPELPVSAFDEQTKAMRLGFYRQTRMLDDYKALAVAEAQKLIEIPTETIRTKDAAIFADFQQRSIPDSIKNTADYEELAISMSKRESQRIAKQLNELAWSYYLELTDLSDLKQALTWSARSLELDRNAMFLDTYAHLLSKLGRKEDAIKTQKEAIAIEKAAGRDTEAYEKELALLTKK